MRLMLYVAEGAIVRRQNHTVLVRIDESGPIMVLSQNQKMLGPTAFYTVS